jgi:zinc and cadmium transporter
MNHSKVILVNVLSALTTTVSAVLVFGFGSGDSQVIPYILAITAGFFIYIAASDIVPELHEKVEAKYDLRPWFLLLGAVIVMILSPIAHEYIDAGHDDHDHDNHSNSLHDHDHEDEAHEDEEHSNESHDGEKPEEHLEDHAEDTNHTEQ